VAYIGLLQVVLNERRTLLQENEANLFLTPLIKII